MPLSDLADALLAAATRAGAEAADAIVSRGRSVTIDVLGGQLEHAERAEGTEIGLRVLIGRRQACVSASDTSAATIAAMAERAVAMARIAPEDPHVGLAGAAELSPRRDAEGLDLADPSPEPGPAELQEAAIRAEAAALANPGVSQVQSASASHSRADIRVAATNGFAGGYARTSGGLYCVAITGSGTAMERDHYGENRVYRSDLPDPEEVGRIAAQRAVARAGARKPPTGACPVLYDERVAAGLIGHLLQAANGASVARGSSWLLGRLGDQVLPRGISLAEDPHRVRVAGSRFFDAEGLPTRRREIVSDGVLGGWTLDLATARQLGMDSTASASRGTASPPSPTITNIALTEGMESRDDLLREMGTGLWITSLIGQSVNPTTGDYSRGASGFWVERGEIAYPVNECTIAGSLPEMLRRIRPANDARRHLSRVVPSLLVEGMTIAGD